MSKNFLVHASSSVLDLKQRYLAQVEQQEIQYDEAQIKAIDQLQELLNALKTQTKRPKWSLLSSKTNCPSLYIFGEVGRGKSMLMDLFYDACPFAEKRRVYFHAFMLEVHAFIHQQQEQQTNAIDLLAKNIQTTNLLLCFDEFHVTDIADAMILQRLFSRLFELGVVIVMTSNRHPEQLHHGGLLKEQFLIFARLLQKQANIVELKAKTDYRLSYSPALKTNYHYPLDDHAINFAENSYQQLTNSTIKENRVLRLLGREVKLSAAHHDTALLSFDELCVQPLGSADYIQLAKQFKNLIVTDIPQLSADKRNEAKRFVTLIDTLYEHKIRLICTAEVAVQELYSEGDGAFEFKRTISRLMEMQSHYYYLKTQA